MKNKDFCMLMLEQEKQKRSHGDDSTADLYRASRNHFAKYLKELKKVVLLKDVTQELVHDFYVWIQKKDLQVNSVNSYMSNLRAMYNRACLGWKGRPNERPFEGLRLKRQETPKRAVSVEVVKQLVTLDLKNEPKKKIAVDIALFCFVACGMPYVDIVHLTRDNLIKGGKILSYRRQKTGALIEMEVSGAMQILIDRYSRPGAKYLFPILSEETTHVQYKACLAEENRYLKEVSSLLKLTENITTYSFRHGWASEAYHQGVPISIISQALGHSSERMTRIYLSAFDADKVGEANKLVSEGVEELMRA